MKHLAFKSPEEELEFLRKVVNTIPAFINVNQIDDPGTDKGNANIWSNDRVYEFTGYSRDKIDELGFKFFTDTIHPDDLSIIPDALSRFTSGETPIFGGLLRIRDKNGEYHWFLGSMTVMDIKNDRPYRIVVNVQNLEEMNDTRNQILQLIRENLQLKNQLRINSLSKREIQVVRHIANGHTDKEIAEELSISPATVKTHRHNIIEKLGLKNKAGIAQFATEVGLV